MCSGSMTGDDSNKKLPLASSYEACIAVAAGPKHFYAPFLLDLHGRSETIER